MNWDAIGAIVLLLFLAEVGWWAIEPYVRDSAEEEA